MKAQSFRRRSCSIVFVQKLSTWLGLALATALELTVSVQAEEAPVRLYLGAINDPFLGMSERYGNLAFNSVATSYRQEMGDFTVGITAAELKHGSDSTIPAYELFYSFAQETWQLGLAKKLRNWGPSQYTSLFLSRNAPAMPSAYIAKPEATAFDMPLLDWLGPWDGEYFIGATEDALFTGMRFAIQPVQGLDIEFLRTAQFGRQGFSNNLGNFWDVLIGNTNEGSTSEANQLAGVSVSYGFPNWDNTLRVYGQFAGEDEAGGLPSCWFYMAGIEFETRLFGTPTNMALETVDSRTNSSKNGFCGPNQAYNNAFYSYANKGVVLGAAVGTQGQTTNLYISHEFAEFTLDWSLGHYVVNDTSDPDHWLSSTRAKGLLATIAISKQFDRLRVDGIIAYQGFDLNSGDMKKGLRTGVGISVAF